MNHSFKTVLLYTWILITIFSASPAFCLTESASLPAPRPWSNWWWPLTDSINPNLYDPGEAMNKYDLFDVGKHSQTWEYNNHRGNNDVSAGHCHGWCGAAIYEPQPKVARDAGGANFSIKDQKGLLSECYYNGVLPGNWDFKEDWPTPGAVWLRLRNEIKGDAPNQNSGPMSFIINAYPGTAQVWNYPIYGYQVDYTLDANLKATGTIFIYFSSDAFPSYASDSSLHSGSASYHFKNVIVSITGKPSISGEWDQGCTFGNSWFPICQPRAIWRPKRPLNYTQYCANPELDQNKINFIMKGWTPSQPPDPTNPNDPRGIAIKAISIINSFLFKKKN
jgi:hypothetical protein